MAMHMERIEAYLESEGLKYRFHDQGHLLTGFKTTSYESPDGTRGVAIAVRLGEGGEYLECIAPALYDATGCPRPEELFRLLLTIMGRSKMIRFEFDPDDNEIRASIECPLEDGSLTKRQFLRSLQALPELIDKWDPAIRAAIAGQAPTVVASPDRSVPVAEAAIPPASDRPVVPREPESRPHDTDGNAARSAPRSRP